MSLPLKDMDASCTTGKLKPVGYAEILGLKIRQEAPPRTVAKSNIQIERFVMNAILINFNTFSGFPSIFIIRNTKFRRSGGLDMEKCVRSDPACWR